MQSRTFSAYAVLDNLWDPDTEPVLKLPFWSKGGELHKFKGKGVKAQNWHADGHRCINQGIVALQRKNPKIKKYFYVSTANGASKEFVKFVFHEPGKENGPFIIQYIGNDEILQGHAHGNAKNTARPFVGIESISLERWLKQIKLEDPNAVYKKETHEEEMQRNLKQTPNLRYEGNNEIGISQDALYSIHPIARNSSNELIQAIHRFLNIKLLYVDTHPC